MVGAVDVVSDANSEACRRRCCCAVGGPVKQFHAELQLRKQLEVTAPPVRQWSCADRPLTTQPPPPEVDHPPLQPAQTSPDAGSDTLPRVRRRPGRSLSRFPRAYRSPRGNGSRQLKIRRGAVVEIDARRAAGVASHGRTAVEGVDFEVLLVGRLGVIGHIGRSDQCGACQAKHRTSMALGRTQISWAVPGCLPARCGIKTMQATIKAARMAEA